MAQAALADAHINDRDDPETGAENDGDHPDEEGDGEADESDNA